jgi:hypothetical protein
MNTAATATEPLTLGRILRASRGEEPPLTDEESLQAATLGRLFRRSELGRAAEQLAAITKKMEPLYAHLRRHPIRCAPVTTPAVSPSVDVRASAREPHADGSTQVRAPDDDRPRERICEADGCNVLVTSRKRATIYCEVHRKRGNRNAYKERQEAHDPDLLERAHLARAAICEGADPLGALSAVVQPPKTASRARAEFRGRWWRDPRLTPWDLDDLGFEVDGEWVFARELMAA